MKKILCFAVILLVSITPLLANPVSPEVRIVEFGFLENQWQLNLKGSFISEQPTLNNCYIKCNADSAFFNEGIVMVDNEIFSITHEDLQSPLTINSENDYIQVFYCTEWGYQYDHLRYGTINDHSLAPSANQSTHRIYIPVMQFDATTRFALDNTPFTVDGDPEAHMGNFQGYVYDQDMNPLPNATVDYQLCPYDLDPIQTDENGWYQRSVNSIIYDFYINYGNVIIDSTIAILPEEINRYDFVLPFVSDNQQVEIAPLKFNISNSPNPFNPVTAISFGRVLEQPAKVKIYNSKGGVVDELNCASGKENISWDAGTTASGVYFYKLEVEGSEVGAGKMLLLK